MTLEQARELARLYFDQALTRGNLAVVDQILAQDFTLFVPPSLGEGPQVEGPDGFRQLVVSLRQGFPDVRFEVHDVTTNEDTVMVSWTMSTPMTSAALRPNRAVDNCPCPQPTSRQRRPAMGPAASMASAKDCAWTASLERSSHVGVSSWTKSLR